MALPKVPENNDDLIDEIKDSRSIAVKSGQLLQRLVGFESTKLKEAREERRENKRKKDRGAVGSAMFGKIKGDKGKGIFGLIGSMGKMLGGGLMKTLGPMWKVLKILFKVLKFTAGGVALLAAGLFFSMSPSSQEAIIEKVTNFFVKIGEVLSSLGKAFGAAFMKNMDDMTDAEGNPVEGLVSKFGKFKDAWKKVLQKLERISINIGGKTYKGLEGFASMMGDLFGKIAGWFLDIGTGIAEVITDPALVWLKLKIAVTNFFGGIGDTLGRFADKFLNMEFFYSLLPDWAQTLAREAGWMEEASQARAQDKLDEMKKLSESEKVLAKRQESVQKTFDEQQAKVDAIDNKLHDEKIKLSDEERKNLEAEREVADQKRLNAMQMVLEAKNERERNVDRFEYAKESYEASTEAAVKERANAIVKQKAGIDVIQVEKDIAELQEKRKELINDSVGGDAFMIGEIDKSLGVFQEMRDALGGKTKVTRKDLTPDMVEKLAVDFGLTSKQAESTALINKFLAAGLQREKDIALQEKKVADIQAKNQAKMDKFLPDAMKEARAEYQKSQGAEIPVLKPVKTGHTGGIITEGGIIAAQKGEMLIDDILVNTFKQAAEVMSGVKLMDLQRDNSVATGGGSPIIIQDNSVKSNQQTQPLILPPSPVLPGNHESPGNSLV